MRNDRRGTQARLLRLATALAVGFAASVATVAYADADQDRRDIAAMLDAFLANVGDVAVHADFWADDLVYTSSSGTRFGKQEILDGMRAAQSDDPDAPGVTYTGRDVDVRLYGDTAVLAFRLLATGDNEAADTAEQYFNTGTLVRRDGRWRVVAWQATRIPAEDAATD